MFIKWLKWLSPREGKKKRILFPVFWDFPLLFRKGEFSFSASWPYNKSFKVETCSVHNVGY